MDMDFTKVTFDSDLDETDDADELRAIIREFDNAQDSNISEFKNAKEAIEGFEVRVGEAQEFKEELAESLSEVSPLSEEEALTYDMVRIRELITEFSDGATVEDETEDEGGKFSNMGQRGTTHTDDDEDARAFAEEHIGDIQGLDF